MIHAHESLDYRLIEIDPALRNKHCKSKNDGPKTNDEPKTDDELKEGDKTKKNEDPEKDNNTKTDSKPNTGDKQGLMNGKTLALFVSPLGPLRQSTGD